MTQTTTTIDRDKRLMVMTRIFDAPRDLVFKTYTDPTLIPQWWGMGAAVTVDTMDLQAGGPWRYVQQDEGGNEFAFRGVYREVVSPERLCYTFEFEGMPGYITLETLDFAEQQGKTLLTSTSAFWTLEDLEGLLQSGAEEGAISTWNRLASLLESAQR